LSRYDSIILGDGHTLEAMGTGAVEVKLKLLAESLRLED